MTSASVPPVTPAASWQEHWLDLAGGRMHYLRVGSGRPLILIHGLMGYSFSWRFAIPAISQQATVFAIDNLGAGFSVAPAAMDCSMRCSAQRVLQFVDALGIEEYDLLGTSHGGAVAMLTAAISVETNDPRLKRLILVAPVNPWSRHGQSLAPFVAGKVGSFLFRHTVERWRFFDHLWLRRLFAQAAKIPSDSLAGYRRPILENGGFAYGRAIVKTWTADLAELNRELPKIRDYPTLLMWGTHDRAVSFSSAKRLQEVFRECRLVSFPGVGHLPYEEAPDDFNHALAEFLRNRP